MKRALLIATSVAAMLSAATIANAQNPPGAEQQDRGIREDTGRPAVKGAPMPREQGQGRSGSTVGQGQGQPGPSGQAEPPGGRFQDEKTNEEIGKPPTGGK
jgi:opacity protein-like surface antigen